MLWNIVKETRKNYLSKNIGSECQNDDTLVRNDYLIGNMRKVEEKLLMNTSIIRTIENVSQETLEIGAKMFTYLNYCPPLPFKNLVKLLQELSQTDTLSPKDLLLALTSIMKSSQNAMKESSRKILRKTLKVLKLVQYENLEIVSNRMDFNNFFGNSTIE